MFFSQSFGRSFDLMLSEVGRAVHPGLTSGLSTKTLLLPSSSSRGKKFHTNSTLLNKDNVDQKEVEHFSKMSNEWWDVNGSLKPLHAMNDMRVPFVKDGLINVKVISEEKAKGPMCLEGLKILDVGCGGGIFAMPLARLGADVTGIDPTKDLIQVAQCYAEANLPSSKLQFIPCTIEEHLKAHKEEYDVIVSSEVVEHVSDKEQFINSCITATKPGGSLFFTTVSQTTIAWLTVVVMAEYILRMMPIGTHEYDKLISPSDLSCFLEKGEAHVLTVNGMMYNPITNKWSWCPYNAINYALHAIKRFK